ncbi:hypothetical protein [Stappia stellulata]|uniref:hypothetical protein n=1 Tax=Stappia stellulata TaxID=71235 RepID=UPI0003FC7B69|nr:hypothetical protein [Stappia stellulata]
MAKDARNGTEADQPEPEAAPGLHRSAAAQVTRQHEQRDHAAAGRQTGGADPAAVPLGTDAEAAGHPPTPQEAAVAIDGENPRAPEADRKRGPEELQGARLAPRTALAAALAIVLLIVVLIAVSW